MTTEDIAELQLKYMDKIKYFETSARTSFQIADAFKTLSQSIVDNAHKNQSQEIKKAGDKHPGSIIVLIPGGYNPENCNHDPSNSFCCQKTAKSCCK